MNTINTDENSRPFGFWLKAVDRLMAAEFASAFESEGITRREWRLLNIVDGTVPTGHTKNDRPLPAHKLARLIELGWVTDADDTWTLTDEGRAAKERLGGIVDSIRAKVTDVVPTEDLATTMATLEQLARAFGWDESTPLPADADVAASVEADSAGLAASVRTASTLATSVEDAVTASDTEASAGAVSARTASTRGPRRPRVRRT